MHHHPTPSLPLPQLFSSRHKLGPDIIAALNMEQSSFPVEAREHPPSHKQLTIHQQAVLLIVRSKPSDSRCGSLFPGDVASSTFLTPPVLSFPCVPNRDNGGAFLKDIVPRLKTDSPFMCIKHLALMCGTEIHNTFNNCLYQWRTLLELRNMCVTEMPPGALTPHLSRLAGTPAP